MDHYCTQGDTAVVNARDKWELGPPVHSWIGFRSCQQHKDELELVSPSSHSATASPPCVPAQGGTLGRDLLTAVLGTA